MSRPKKSARAHADINADYARLAMRAGDLAYRVRELQRQIDATHAEMLILNQEAAALPQESSCPPPK